MRARSAATVVLLLSVLPAISPPGYAQIEPQAVSYLINPDHNASISSPSLRLPLELKWTFNAPGELTYPIIADGRIFFGTLPTPVSPGYVYAISQVDGHMLWRVPLSSGSERQSFAYENGRLFWLAGNGWCYAIDPANGNGIWFRNFAGITSTTAPLVVKNGMVYYTGSGSTDRKVFAIRASDGTPVWSYPVADSGGIPSASNEGLYVSFNSRYVIKLDLQNGALLWQFDSGAGTNNGIAIPFGNQVYLSGFPGRRLDVGTGGLLTGSIPPPGTTVGPMSLRNGTGFQHANFDTIVGWDTSSNLEIWRRNSSDYFMHYPIAINNYVFACHANNPKFSAYDAFSGATLWTGNAWGSNTFISDWATTRALTRPSAGEGLILVPIYSELFCFASTVYSLTDPSAEVWAGDNVATTWLVPGGRPKLDWVGLFKTGTDNRQWLDFRYTNGATLGTVTLKAPMESGDYEFRYLLNDGYTSTTSSGHFTVKPINATLTVSPSTGTAGVTRMQVSFTAPAGRPNEDWIGLYKVGESNRAYRWWAYVNGATSGSFYFTAPSEGGQYELRYLINNGYTSVATSNTITINALDPSQFTLTADPSTVAAGGPLSVSFTAPPARSALDWIGLYKVGDPNRSYGWWRYTNGAESGTFNLSAPLTPGQYEFRYLLEDGYTSIKTSSPVTVQ